MSSLPGALKSLTNRALCRARVAKAALEGGRAAGGDVDGARPGARPARPLLAAAARAAACSLVDADVALALAEVSKRATGGSASS